MIVYTSVTNCYLPKARVLAESVKKYAPEASFVLLLSDQPMPGFDLAKEPFDRILFPKDLDIRTESLPGWLFSHAVVELCTAVKGPALVKLLGEGADKVVYLDPDTRLYGPLDELSALLDEHPVVLTPHMTAPNDTAEVIWETEISCLKHGCYNLGFLAVRNEPRGLEFARWWRDRLEEFCFDDIPNGLFTDQRWVDLAPCFFPYAHILRDPTYNVATWNITRRHLSLNADGRPLVEGKPLHFYHFSGYDNGTDARMSEKYDGANADLAAFRREYFEAIVRNGQETLVKYPCVYGFYSDGTPVTKHQRWLYRWHAELRAAFPDPFVASGYLQWYRAEQEAGRNLPPEAIDELRQRQIAQLQTELNRANGRLSELNGQLVTQSELARSLNEQLVARNREMQELNALATDINEQLRTRNRETTELREQLQARDREAAELREQLRTRAEEPPVKAAKKWPGFRAGK